MGWRESGREKEETGKEEIATCAWGGARSFWLRLEKEGEEERKTVGKWEEDGVGKSELYIV